MSQELIKRIISSIMLIPIALFFVIKGSFFFSFFILTCFVITLYEWHMMSKNKSYTFFGYIFIIFSFYTVYFLRNELYGDYIYFLMILLICIFTDIGGYIFGRIFKGPKLTKISPNKTYSGMFGGYFLSIIFMVLFFINLELLIDRTNIKVIGKELSLNNFLLIIAISTASQFGDIVISYFKRLSKIKDTGKIIPGHGGLLDRIDGMIFAFPISYLIFKIFY
tara:strand:- start:5051 stop:5716 length:666 start_codon:yes stop_codon:yes gene_type:complete